MSSDRQRRANGIAVGSAQRVVTLVPVSGFALALPAVLLPLLTAAM